MNDIQDCAPQAGFSMQMVAELAAKIQDPGDILERYGMTIDDLQHLKRVPAFQQAYTEAKRFWESDANAKDRIAVKAAAMLEDSLLELHSIFHNASLAGAVRLAAFKEMTVLAKVNGGEAKQEAGKSAATINISIDMGAGQKYAASVAAIDVTDYEQEGDDGEPG